MATVLDRVRRPEYTGDNRCVPCTAVNTVVAIGVAVAVGYAVTAAAGSALGTAVGGLVFTLSVAAIYLRGYLVPGTPTLTKRYFPERVLAWFDKADPGSEVGPGVDDPAGDIEPLDVEAELVGAGVLEEKSHGDLGLSPAFSAEFRDQIERERDEESDREAVASIVGIDPDELAFEDYGAAFVAHAGGRNVGRWESRAAFLADVAAGRVLPAYYDDWDDTGPAGRGQLLAGLRLFVEQCPACDGQVRFGQDVVESCCRTTDVIAVTCEDCGARLFEVNAAAVAPEA